MIAWLRRKDPGLCVVRRGARVTVAACLGFYVSRYVLNDATMATYALFGAVALGGLSQIPGGGRQQARTLLSTLPVAWILVTLGTLLAVWDVAAAIGMFVLGFVVSYAAVGGPRLVGLVNGLQLLYILPCFPPYEPGTLWLRLAGLTTAVVLLALADVTMWPDLTPASYESILARSVSTMADCLDAAADSLRDDPEGRPRLAALLAEATDAAEALRPSRLDPAQRPASASRHDHAMMQASSIVRYTVARLSDLFVTDGTEQLPAPAGAILLTEAAASARRTAAWLSGGGDPPDPAPVATALDTYRSVRRQTDPNGIHPDRLRLGSMTLGIGDGIRVLVTVAQVAAGVHLPPDTVPATGQPGQFWFAYVSTWQLWWRRFRVHFTPRSVYFQGALRLALALSLARLLTGVLDLSHGFWVLLAILTLLRTSAAQTRMASWPVLSGTVLGAVVAGFLLVVVAEQHVFAVVLPFVMLAGFSVGPLLGILWGQAIFTVVVAFVFAQLAPSGWRLAEARVVDVALGVGIGVLIGLFAWPRGGTGELHRATGRLLRDCARAIRETVAVLTGAGAGAGALPEARHDITLAEACYALYQSERRGPARVDWQALMVAGHHAVRGAETLLRTVPTGQLVHCVRPLRTMSDTVANGYADVGTTLIDRRTVVEPRPSIVEDGWPTDLGPVLYQLADLRVWLEGLADDLGHIVPASPPVLVSA